MRAWMSADRCAWGYAVVLLALPWLAVYSFESIAFLLFLGAVLAGGPTVFSEAWRLASRTGPGRVIVALTLWLAVASAWAPAPLPSLGKAAGLAAHFAAGAVFIAAAGQVPARFHRRLMVFTGLAVAVICAIYGIELATGARVAAWGKGIVAPPGLAPDLAAQIVSAVALTKISRGVTVIVVLLGPAVLLVSRLPRGAWWAAALAVGGAATIFAMPNDTAKIAVMLGAATALAAWGFRRAILRGLGGLAAAAMLVVPWALHAGLVERFLPLAQRVKVSAFHRLEIYRYTSGLVAERPVFGWGFDASRYLSRAAPRVIVDPATGQTAPLISLHPHDAMIQIWLETGAVGAGFAALLCLALGRGLSAAVRSRTEGAAVAAMLASIVPVLAFGYGIWQYQWIATLLIAAGVVRFALSAARKEAAA